ncbi:MAG: hypothetical protein IPI85_13960 [Dehalococcoidia bacterium]|nr:hypothetical protein [Dehalococcoidia bacterium]
MTATPALERTITTYLEGRERSDQPENIHTDAVALEMGYRGGLVYGTSVYGWATPLIMDLLGEPWLRGGWADVRVLRPVYAGEQLTIAATPAPDGAYQVDARDGHGRVRVAITVGLGSAAWLEDHHRSGRLDVEPLPSPRPLLRLETAPVGTDLPALRAGARDRLASLFDEASARERGPIVVDGREVQSPASFAGRMTWYTHACWDYAGPSLHARSLVQHLGVVDAGEPVTVTGRLRAVYERNGHHYSETDGVIFAADGREAALTRHTSIFHVAKR